MVSSLLCARPGCQGVVAAWFTYDYTAQRVWLDDAPSTGGGNHWALCAAHAARFRPPRGWEQVDLRTVGAPPPAAPGENFEVSAEIGGGLRCRRR